MRSEIPEDFFPSGKNEPVVALFNTSLRLSWVAGHKGQPLLSVLSSANKDSWLDQKGQIDMEY